MYDLICLLITLAIISGIIYFKSFVIMFAIGYLVSFIFIIGTLIKAIKDKDEYKRNKCITFFVILILSIPVVMLIPKMCEDIKWIV